MEMFSEILTGKLNSFLGFLAFARVESRVEVLYCSSLYLSVW